MHWPPKAITFFSGGEKEVEFRFSRPFSIPGNSGNDFSIPGNPGNPGKSGKSG